jgi:ATP-dependent RNA helicase DDX41
MIMIALQEEMRMPLERDEGPLGLIICPSRELATQTKEVIEGYTDALKAVSSSSSSGSGSSWEE